MREFTGTITAAGSEDVDVSMLQYETGFQITAIGAGTLTVSTQENDLTGYVVQSSQSGETLIYDIVAVDTIRLAATGSDIDYKIGMLSNRASIPTSNWADLNRGND